MSLPTGAWETMMTGATCRTLLTSAAIGTFLLLIPDIAQAADANNNQMQPDQMRASQMIGSDVYDSADNAVGRVVDIVLDPNGQVVGVIIGVAVPAGAEGKDVAVPMQDFHSQHRHLTVDRTPQQLQQAQNYQLNGANASSGTSTLPAEGGQAPATGNRMSK
jgi:sporulation protein YlmC with PRC-barrel domain